MEKISNGVSRESLDGYGISSAGVVKSGETKYERGMRVGSKQLYAGKEDKKGRSEWQNQIPKDVGKKAENDEPAQWALVVRNVKVYNDPRKVLEIHSMSVQSPLLKTLLASVPDGYPASPLPSTVSNVLENVSHSSTAGRHCRKPLPHLGVKPKTSALRKHTPSYSKMCWSKSSRFCSTARKV